MILFKLLKVMPRLVFALLKFAFKMFVVFAVLAFIFDVQFALGASIVLLAVLSIIFVNNLFSVLSENRAGESTRRSVATKEDYWTPGQPAVTTDAHEQGFFYKSNLE